MTSALRDELERARGQQPGVAGPGADEVGGHGPAPRARRRSAAARATSAPERLGLGARRARRAPRRCRRRRRRTRAASARPAPRTCACAPTGVWQSASSARTSARSAASARAAGGVVDRRDERLVAGARRHGQAALAGGGDELVERRAARRRGPGARSPARGQHDRVVVAVGELAQARVDVAAQLDHVEVRRAARAAARRGAATTSRRARPRPARPATRAPHSASRGSARGGTAAMTMPVGQLGRHVLGRVHRAVDRRRRAARASSSRTQRSLSDAGLAAVAARHDLDQLVLAAEQRRPPGAPAPAPARCRASRSSRPALERADVVGRRRLGRRSAGGACASAGASSRPNSSRSSCWRPCPLSFRRIVGSCSSRCMTARATASTRARSRGDSVSQRPAFSARTWSTISAPCSRSARWWA